MVAVRGTLDPALLLLPFALALLYAFVLGLSLVVSVLQAYFRDVVPILSAALLPWFFLTPIFFRVQDIDKLAERDWARVGAGLGQPVAPFIRSIRSILYEGAVPSAGTVLYVVVAAGVSLVVGRAVFRRMQAELAVVL